MTRPWTLKVVLAGAVSYLVLYAYEKALYTTAAKVRQLPLYFVADAIDRNDASKSSSSDTQLASCQFLASTPPITPARFACAITVSHTYIIQERFTGLVPRA